MKVRELIAALAELNGELDVRCYCHEGGILTEDTLFTIESIEPMERAHFLGRDSEGVQQVDRTPDKALMIIVPEHA